jgi:SpoVK/Ycf46/Vps4 family AAA+-type ATPase
MGENSKNNLLWTHWSVSENGIEFLPAKKTISKLPSDYYKVKYSDYGFYLAKAEDTNYSNESNSPKVLNLIKEVKLFWEIEKEYKKIKLAFSKGILIYGPPGNGKSIVLNSLVKETIDSNGLAIDIDEPEDYMLFVSIIKKMEPKRKVILTIKNIDYMIDKFGFISVIDMIDKMSKSNNLIYVATTSSIDRIDEILYNNSSSFDKKIKIESPSSKEREEFIKNKISDLMTEQQEVSKTNTIDIKKWTMDTEGFSFSNLKELIVSVILYKENYTNKIKEIRTINKKFEEKTLERGMGFKFENLE